MPLTPLEDRTLPSASLIANLTGGILRVTDWSSGDTLTVRQTATGVTVGSVVDGSEQVFVGVERVVVDVQSDAQVVNDTSGLNGGAARTVYLSRRDSTGRVFAQTGVLDPAPLSTPPNVAVQPPIAIPTPTPVDPLDASLSDSDVQALANALASDRTLDRIDMLRLFAQVANDNTVTPAELNDLNAVVSPNPQYDMPDAVRTLATKVIGDDPANGRYQGSALGDLAAGSSGDQLNQLVGKWFLGRDRPIASARTAYQSFTGPLFQNEPSPQDVVQGRINDCYFLAALAVVAQNDPQAIRNMFTDNGDGTFTVRFFLNGMANYVTVDRALPVSTVSGLRVYADFGGATDGTAAEMWVALAEKAYAQINESGGIGQDGSNSYDGIAMGYGDIALQQITGRPADFTWIVASSADQLAAAVAAGRSAILNSRLKPDNGVVPSHAYAVVSYDSAAQTFALYSPWGNTINLTWSQIRTSFYGVWQMT